MQLPTASKQNTSLGLFIVCILIAIVLIFFLVLPKNRELSEKRLAAQTSAENLTTVQQREKLVEQMGSRITQNQKAIDNLDLAIPQKPDITRVYALLESLAKSANLVIKTISASDDFAVPTDGSASAAPGPGASPDASIIGGGSGIATGPQLPSQTLGSITADVQLNGSLIAIQQFLTEVQNSLRLMDIQSLDIGVEQKDGEDTSDNGSMTMRAQIRLYYQKDK